MGIIFLTADEIYAIDNLTEESFSEIVLLESPERRELIEYLHNKNLAIKRLRQLAHDKNAENQRLLKELRERDETRIRAFENKHVIERGIHE